MPKKNVIQTGKKVASKASHALKNKNTSKAGKSIAGSALSNRRKKS